MSADRLKAQTVDIAMLTLRVDQVTAEVAGLLADAGIDCMLVKGPVIGEWLYPGEARAYGDSDLVVAPSNWHRAIAVLVRHGFRNVWGSMAHPGMESFASTAFVRGSDNVDLHCMLAGLEAPAEEVWDALWHGAKRQVVAGGSIAVPGRSAVLMHLTLHAAQHTDQPKALEDLRRGIGVAGVHEWRQAAELAEKLAGLAAFASGLRRLPEGSRLARALEVDHVSSAHHDLRLGGVPTAERLHELLSPGLTMAERGSLVFAELFPQPRFMRWWAPVARRGTRGLWASYPVRWVWLAVKVPRGLIELGRVRRRRVGRHRGSPWVP